MSKKIERGIGENKYKPGVIKIAASSADLSKRQLRFFEAAVSLQKKYKIPIATHSPSGGLEHLEVLMQMGVLPEHLYLSHLENDININNFDLKLDHIKTIISKKANIVITNFGTSNKGDRYKCSINLMKFLKSNGFLDQTLISADSNWRWRNNELKLRDSQYRGAEKTYSYVHKFIIPALKKELFTDADFYQMLVTNPKNLFNF